MNLICQLLLYCSFIVIEINAENYSYLDQIAQKMSTTNALLKCIVDAGKDAEVFKHILDNNTYDILAHYFLREDFVTLKRDDTNVQVIKESYEKLDAYDMKEEKIYKDYASYDEEVFNRKFIMNQIFKNYLKNKVAMSSNRMCQNNENKFCEIIALVESTDDSMLIFNFLPRCINGECVISRYNFDDIDPKDKSLFGNVPTVFRQLEDKTFQAYNNTQRKFEKYNFY
ncbi:uncharacterized protein LOC126904327 isoform X2 [Daktulosphaira vitifoliae]|uniref:uncharacterized protein LOC126904327 isoform X2 n=1 Tax=Daktulosphaira vitifoliae TaxID=58002 RepID=UPI0021AA5613|nr:uncharacterized protein LOC126904327 isoform X2 [Daktulosphaira vitifoliae]